MKSMYINFHKIIMFGILFILTIVMLIGIAKFMNSNRGGDTSSIEDAFNSALVQCYALEGAYPVDYHHLSEYGIWIDDDKYYYDYEPLQILDSYVYNYKPTIIVVRK